MAEDREQNKSAPKFDVEAHVHKQGEDEKEKYEADEGEDVEGHMLKNQLKNQLKN